MKNLGSESDNLKESLSAVLDGEANELELRRVLNQLKKDSDFRDIAKQYQKTNSMAQGCDQATLNIDISDAIRDQIANLDNTVIDPVHPQQKNQKKVSFLFLSLSKMAIAASVTVAVIVGIRSWKTESIVWEDYQSTDMQQSASSEGSLILTSNSNEASNFSESAYLSIDRNSPDYKKYADQIEADQNTSSDEEDIHQEETALSNMESLNNQ